MSGPGDELLRTVIIAPRTSVPGLTLIFEAEGMWADQDPRSAAPLLLEEDGVHLDDACQSTASVLVAGSPEGAEIASSSLGVRLDLLSVAGRLRIRPAEYDSRAEAVLSAAGIEGVAVPVETVLRSAPPGFEVLATATAEGVEFPLIARKGPVVLLGVDPGAALLFLLNEEYVERREDAEELPGVLAWVYRELPFALRLLVYRYAWRRLRSGAEKERRFRTSFPVDPAGWALHRLMVRAVELASGTVPRVWRWPGGASHAACLTHDIEPRRYAYDEGLPRLLDILRRAGLRSTISVVAEPGFELPRETLATALAEGHEIVSHGLHHDGRFNLGGLQTRKNDVMSSRRAIETLTGARVRGFRTPWLQRTSDLPEVLESSGIEYDSTMVDSDTSMKRAWHGAGVSYNFPYRLPSRSGDRRLTAVLEIPVAGPQDMEMVFAGFGVRRGAEALAEKLAWCDSVGGVYVGIVHAGVYGRADAEKREYILERLIGEVKDRGSWVSTLGGVHRWWQARRHIRVSRSAGRIGSLLVRNDGTEGVDDVWVGCGDVSAAVRVSACGSSLATREMQGLLLARVGTLAPGEERALELTPLAETG